MTWSISFLLDESLIFSGWKVCSYSFSYSESFVVSMLFISHLVRSIQSILKTTSQFSFVIQYVSFTSSFVVWNFPRIVCFRILILSSSNLSSSFFDFSIFNSCLRTHSSLKNVLTVLVSISPLSIAVLSVWSVQIYRRVFRVSRSDFSSPSRLSRFPTFSDYWKYSSVDRTFWYVQSFCTWNTYVFLFF